MCSRQPGPGVSGIAVSSGSVQPQTGYAMWRIRAVFAGIRLEGDVLENVRLEDRLVRIFAGKRDERARAADDALARRDQRGRETRLA